jgi:hypothetical protein
MKRTKRISIRISGLGLALTAAVAAGQVQSPSPGTEWEQIQLFTPSKALLAAERKGRVTIYDGLYHEDVDRAMDEQFGRIERMMFIRSKQRTETGFEADSDCD